jgi:AraC-like DNA-binding protein
LVGFLLRCCEKVGTIAFSDTLCQNHRHLRAALSSVSPVPVIEVTRRIEGCGRFGCKLNQWSLGLRKDLCLEAPMGVRDETPAENLRLSELAAAAGMSLHYFSQLVRQSTGLSPYQYVLQQRMEHAEALLRDPKAKIIEASAMTGFVNPRHFARAFHRLVGVTPTEFRVKPPHKKL